MSIKTELAYVLEREKKLPEAQVLFEECIKAVPSYYRAHEGLARVFQQLNQLGRAEIQAKLAVSLRSDEGTLGVLADIYEAEGKTAHAHKFWLAVLKKNPRDQQVWIGPLMLTLTPWALT